MFKLKGGKMAALVLILISISLAVLAQLSLKRGVSSLGTLSVSDLVSPKIFSIFSNVFVVGGLLLYVVASGLWIVVLSQEELSFAYPLIALGYVITAVLAKFMFNENLTLFRILGISFIALGAYLIILKI